MAEYIVHLSSDENPLLTACGELWQNWQKPEESREPVAWSPGVEPEVGDTERLCGACQRLGYSSR
jgi:hypothetical protein